MNSRMQRSNRNAFTIMEVVIAAAITVLLMGLLLPALGRAREIGRRTKCLSNMRQLSVGVMTYAAENNGQLPPYIYKATKVGAGWTFSVKTSWSMADMGMTGKPDILRCPSDRNPWIMTTTDPSGAPIKVPVSYAYNFEPFMQARTMAMVGFSKKALFFDGNPSGAMSNVWYGTDPGAGGLNCVPDAAGKTWICHVPAGNPNGAASHYVPFPSLGGHGNHANDYCGPCGGDTNQFNNLLVKRRHLDKANIIFMDGHGEFHVGIPTGGI
jgi:prepilin-type processing-associated H-X9-DG protein